MKTLLLVAAESREFSGLLQRCRHSEKLHWPLAFARIAETDGKRYVMVANGAGPALAGEASDLAAKREKIEAVISTGFCGALDPGLEAGAVFVASRVEALDQGRSYEAQAPVCALAHATGTLASVNRVIQTVDEKRQLRERGAAAVEMEASAVAARAAKWGLPFFCVRAVTDTAGENLLLDFNAARDGDGRLSMAYILKSALQRPSVLAPELYKLHKRTRLAAGAMGDFLADCRF